MRQLFSHCYLPVRLLCRPGCTVKPLSLAKHRRNSPSYRMISRVVSLAGPWHSIVSDKGERKRASYVMQEWYKTK